MKKNKTVTITKKDHREALREGADPEYALKPGRHTFSRGSFRGRHPEIEKAEKVAISIKLDRDIIDFFKQRAAAPNAAPYQTQINTALRQVVEGRTADQIDINKLVSNEKLISAIAERVRELV